MDEMNNFRLKILINKKNENLNYEHNNKVHPNSLILTSKYNK